MNDFEYWHTRLYNSYLFQDITDTSRCFLVDQTSKEFLQIDPTAPRSYLIGKNEYTDYISKHGLKGFVQYHPKETRRIIKTPSEPTILNLYVPPPWLRQNYLDGTPLPITTSPPALFDDFLEHLVGGHQPSKLYVYDWLATSLQARNFTFLTAVGEAGVGKTVFSQIMQALHGGDNFTEANDSIFKSRFNASLSNKTMIFIDEFSLTKKEEIDRVKEVANDSIRVEAKGIDARTVRNYASFYFASNHLDAIKLPADDRRFSIVQLTETRLVDRFNQSEIDYLKSDACAAQLGQYLMQRAVTSDMKTPFKNSTTYQDVADSSLSNWEHTLINQTLTTYKIGDFLTVKEMQDLITATIPYYTVPPGRVKLKEFARRFRKQLKFTKKDGILGVSIIGEIKSIEGFEGSPKLLGVVK